MGLIHGFGAGSAGGRGTIRWAGSGTRYQPAPVRGYYSDVDGDIYGDSYGIGDATCGSCDLAGNGWGQVGQVVVQG